MFSGKIPVESPPFYKIVSYNSNLSALLLHTLHWTSLDDLRFKVSLISLQFWTFKIPNVTADSAGHVPS